ncbi:SDR family NAD(P)-dependent oxidoreductase [Myceligenerans pegani]|uniref:SDR family oxidoreductase n=1 Tax=Myceligenerans pegani TaxID=2776917 RepID=A0ABR9N5R8_9MICO|nr:SDR family oxidoreductase [Myceligenerans sp. TRM 65318]MBE1878347.1 SDR family oxidoreductase [Myceligenerans sp. TRM 65318]MBE3020618.1 SDR family oxidoreductase [Myceligenerans sp. TRM 65318]
MYTYRGTTTLVTGASRGLGAAYAAELARRGSDLVLVARSGSALDEVAARLRTAHDVAVTTIAADLADRDQVTDVVRTLDDSPSTIDLLLNNAGAGAVGPFLDRALEPNQVSVDLNISALMTLTHALGRTMASRGSGGIINIASSAAFQPMPYQASYAGTKAFVLSFTEALAEELRGQGVRVMAAHPGATGTTFFDGATRADGTPYTMDPRITDSADTVARRTLDDFARGRSASYPGRRLNQIASWLPRYLPRTTTARLTGKLNRTLGFDSIRVHAA